MKELLEGIRVRKNGNGNGKKHHLSEEPKLLIKDSIFVRHEGSLVKVKFDDILWLKGDGNYTTLVTKNAVISVRNILKEFESVLPSGNFLRIHKSYMVQIGEISAINNKEVQVGKDWIPVGRTFYQELLKGIQRIGNQGD